MPIDEKTKHIQLALHELKKLLTQMEQEGHKPEHIRAAVKAEAERE